MRIRIILGVSALVFILLFTQCSKFRKVQKHGTWQQKYEAAVEYYEQEDYYHAQVLIEEVLPIVIGKPEGEKASFMRAYCYFYQRQYLLASHYFEAFFQTYSRSDYAEEALYMYAYSLYQDSPDYNLDQTSTVNAINAMQSYINRYPYSEFAEDANAIIYELQEKLAKKTFENARQYYKLRSYRAAVVAFEEFMNGFPDSRMAEEAFYLMIDSQYQYARQSVRAKEIERLNEVLEMYNRFTNYYPESEYSKQVNSIYEDSIKELEQLNNS